MSTIIRSVSDRVIPQLTVGSLQAEYSLARSQVTGDWVAVGTIHSLQPVATPPAWILVGLGDNAPDAVEDLRRRMEWQTIRTRVQLG
jgi:hypothetical protein